LPQIRVRVDVEEVQSSEQEIDFRIPAAERTPDTSSWSWVQTNLVGLVEALKGIQNYIILH